MNLMDDGSNLMDEYRMEAGKKEVNDLLIETNVMSRLNYKLLSNHLQHHWAITIICISTTLTAMGAFAVGLLLYFLK